MLGANRLLVSKSLLNKRPNTLRCRFLSQMSDSGNEVESAGTSSLTDEEGEATASTPIFPWRHEEDKLARFVPGTEEHETKGHLLSSVNTPLGNSTLNAITTAYMFLDLPIWQLVFFSHFKAELTESFSWAFVQGINNLLLKLANEPNPPDVREAIDFQKTLSKSDDESSETPDLQELDFILEKQLLDLYQSSARNLADGNEVFLKSQPYSAELVSLYCIPYISRSNILSEPSLLTFYKEMLEKSAVEKQADLAKLRKEHLETGKMESTVIAQVLVWCKERFYVKDTASGTIVQGKDDDNEKDVPHLVRMEMIVKTVKDSSFGNFTNKHGNWIITDIDDLVGGNLVV